MQTLREEIMLNKKIQKIHAFHDKGQNEIPYSLYSQIINNYENIVKQAATLIKCLNKKEIYNSTIIFEYLLWNGYFSKNKNYKYSETNRYNFDGFYGLDVMKGTGVCINNVGLHIDIMNELGHDAHMIGTYINENDQLEYRPNIKRNFDIKKSRFNLSEELIARKYGNHTYTLINCEEICFILDPTNLTTFYFEDDLKIKNYFGTKTITLKPESLLLLERLNKDQYIDILNKLKSGYQDYGMTKQDILIYTRYLLDFCNKHKKTFDMFYEQIQEDIESIDESLKEYKKLEKVI